MALTFQGKRVSRAWLIVLREARKHVAFTLNSGRRTMAEQSALYRQNMLNGRPRSGRPLTARPSPIAPHIRVGRPDHAIDVDSLDGGETRLQKWLRKQGARAENTVAGESWHLEVPLRDLLRLARKIKGRKASPVRVSADGVELVAGFEGFRPRVYRDAVGVETIGYGETARPIIERYRAQGITEPVARQLLKDRLNYVYGKSVRRLVSVPLSQRQFDALVSFTYNLGAGALSTSTLLGELNHKHYAKAANEFLKWDKAGGRRLEGLTRRRRAERALFLKGSQAKTRVRAALYLKR